ncbi:MAG TPA: hypothetical protein VFW30_10735 [Bryocella sp.]|nr:hypothetical protein [Bryocella sp.]
MGNSTDEVVSLLTSQAEAVARLAQDSGGFSAAFAAFDSKDPDGFRWVLERLELLPYCELICEWLRVKVCVLRCNEICPIREGEKIPSLEDFARAVARLSENEEALRRVIDAVNCGDADAYSAVLKDLKLSEFCYVLCNWICSVGYRRVCERVCMGERVPIADPVAEIRAAAKAMDSVLSNKKLVAALSDTAVAIHCERLRSAIEEAGLLQHCEFICHLVCSYRRIWVCREICRVAPPVVAGIYAIEEARNFALALRQLTSQPRLLRDLVSAAEKPDAKAWAELISRVGLGPYCLQVCGWVTSRICHEVCRCVCPPPGYPPIFQKVGLFEIYGEIDPATGLTSTSQPVIAPLYYGGGPNFAFFRQLQLGGYCPIYSPSHPGVQMMYRFLYSQVATTLAGAISASQTTITVAASAAPPPTPFDISVCNNSTPNSNETAEIMTVTHTAGTTWTVTRGQNYSTAASAPAGALVGLKPAPITDNFSSPVQIGFQPHIGLWPSNLAGVAGPLISGWTDEVWVVPNHYQPPYPSPDPGTVPPDPGPPAGGSTWYPPKHYIAPDVNGWVLMDENLTAPGITTFLGFDSTQVVPGGCELAVGPCFGGPGGAPAGTAVPAANQGVGTDLMLIFQATRVGVSPSDYSNALCRIHVNNWAEVNNLWLVQWGIGGCCDPIDQLLSVQYTVDHEMMHSGGWTLEITSESGGTTCSPSAPGVITPAAGPRGGSGTIVEDTTSWVNCSYQVLQTARAGLTTGLVDNDPGPLQLTFCICGHGDLPVPGVKAKKR